MDGADSLTGPRVTTKHSRHGDEDHCSEEDEKDISSGLFTPRSPPGAAKQIDFMNGPNLEHSNSLDSRDYERQGSGMIKQEFQGIPTFLENVPTSLGESS